jgi:predicted acetyltransferase
MLKLVVPRLSVAASVRAAAREHGDDVKDEYRDALARLKNDELADWVDALLADTRERAPRLPGNVPSTHLWWVDDDTFLGRLQLRHRLNPFLREIGGHIGYHVIPPARRQGHGTAMLAAALPVAAALGMDCVLITCDTGNLGSRKVIEANGGLLQDQRGDKLRFWVPTA